MNLSEDQFGAFWRSWWWVFVKGWHVLEFAVLAGLLFSFFLHRQSQARFTASAWAGLLSLGYAATDEFHQTFVPLRGGRVTDWLIDALGVSIGHIVVNLWNRRRTDAADLPGSRGTRPHHP